MKKIGLFGGTFSPPHNEHIFMAKAFISELNLDKLIILPSNVSPHKTGTQSASASDRLNMAKLAFSGVDKVEVSPYEICNGGVSYTYLTTNHFKNLYKDAKLYLLVGSDMLENFPKWKHPESIVEDCTLCLIERQGDLANVKSAINLIKDRYGHTVIKLNGIGKNLSSTYIRTALKLGIYSEDTISAPVLNYIKTNKLYSGDALYGYVCDTLPIKRKIHTLGVIVTAIELAKKLGVDTVKTETAALLHDVAKYEDAKNYPLGVVPSDCPLEVCHQYLGAYISKEKLGVVDNDVLNAIKYHTTGRQNMSILEKIIYVADLIEPSRQYAGVNELREKVYKDFERGFKFCTQEVLKFLQNKDGDIYYLSIDCANYYKEKI